MKAKALTGWLCLAVGGIIYILFRPRTLLYGIFHHLTSNSYSDVGKGLGGFFVYSLPGGLWSLGYVLVMDSALKYTSLRLRLMMTGIIPFVGMVSEILQYLFPNYAFGRVQLGTFDSADLLAYLLPYVIYVMIVVFKNKLR